MMPSSSYTHQSYHAPQAAISLNMSTVLQISTNMSDRERRNLISTHSHAGKHPQTQRQSAFDSDGSG
jgi:hypothetical protein